MIRIGFLPESFGAALHAVLPRYFSPDRGWKVRAEKSPDSSNFIRRDSDGGYTVFYGELCELAESLGDLLCGDLPAAPWRNAFSFRGVMIDCSRGGVPKIDFLKRCIAKLALSGLSHLALYTEDTFEIEGEPWIGFARGGYSKAEIRELDAFAAALGVELFPCIQTLGHLEHVFKNPRYQKFSDGPRILNGNAPGAMEFLEKLILEASSPYRSNRIHLGADEPWGLGHGSSLNFDAPVKPKEIYLRHLTNLAGICERNGLHGIIWSDYILGHSGNEALNDGELARIPSSLVLDYWNYVAEEESEHDANLARLGKTGAERMVSPGLRSWNRLFGNRAKAALTGEVFLRSALRNGVRSAMTTLWGDDGSEALFLTNWAALMHQLCQMRDPGMSLRSIRLRLERIAGFAPRRFEMIDRMNSGEGLALKIENPNNCPGKLLFYDDPMYAFFTHACDAKSVERHFAEAFRMLRDLPPVSGEDRSLRKLGMLFADALRRKLRASLCAREGYKSQDRALLTESVCFCGEAEKAFGVFRREYRKLWMEERKVFGFEIVDVRLAGVMARLETLRTALRRHLRTGSPIEEFDLHFPADFSARDAGSSYATVSSKSHNAIWMM